MTRSVGLLRGINVGPTTKVPMALLRSLFAEAGATDVVTLLNSGNVVFSGSVDVPALLARIRAETGVQTHLLVLDAERFRRIADAFPASLTEALEVDESRLVVAFMPTVPAVELPDVSPELIALGKEAVYQSLPNGVSNTKLKPAFWKQFPPETTARNLRTVKKLLELLD